MRRLNPRPACWKLSAHLCLPLVLNLVLVCSSWAVRPSESAAAETNTTPRAGVAREPDAQQQQAVDTLKRDQPTARVNWDPSSGTPSQVSGKRLGAQTLSNVKGARSKPVDKGSYAQRAVAVMDNLAPLYRLKDASSDFKSPRAEEKDKLGFSHQRLDQVYQGVPVIGGSVTVHFDASGAPYRVDGRYVPDISMQVTPAISAQASIDAAKVDFASRGFTGTSVSVLEQPRLVVYAMGPSPKLAYELVLQHSPANVWIYWIDAVTGEVLAARNRVCHIAPPTSSGGAAFPLTGNVLAGEGGGNKPFSGWSENSIFYMYSPTNFYFVYNNADKWTESAPPAPSIVADRSASVGVSATATYSDANTYAFRTNSAWGSNDRAEVSIAANMQATFSYYANVHGRNGYDGNGTVVVAVAHYGSKYVNAFWNGSGMYFGDGDGVTANSLAVADVCAHELTHAVTETTANLIYQNESGALNESFSDIFGTLVEFYAQPDGRTNYPSAAPGTGDWLCGEDCWLDGKALRDLRNPSSTTTLAAGYQQPSKYKGTYWQDYNTDTWDNGGVHQNSGVQNFFFYLLSEGGKGTNGGISYDLSGIGIDNAQKVAYRTLTVYCSQYGTDYKTVQDMWVAAAIDLNSSWVPAVKAAWRAVGIGITSPLLVKGRARLPIASYQISAPDAPSAYSASNLPTGLSLSGNVISGTPTTPGEYDATITATTGGVTFSDTLHFSIIDPSLPVVQITSPADGAIIAPWYPILIQSTITDLNKSGGPGVISDAVLLVNDAPSQTNTIAPYSFTYRPTNEGTYKLTVRATDTDKDVGEDSVTVQSLYEQPGEVRKAFVPPGANDFVQALSSDEKGRIYIGGKFTNLTNTNGVTNGVPVVAQRVARLFADGRIDTSFYSATGPNAQIRDMQYDQGRQSLYIAGDFTNVQGVARTALARLAVGRSPADEGKLDAAFDAQIASSNTNLPPNVRTVLVQDGGQILIAGSFSSVRGVSRTNIARLNPDGTLDTTFVADTNNSPVGANGAVNAIAMQSDGKILVGGQFTQINGISRPRIARLNLNGSLDTTFDVGSGVEAGFDGPVNSVSVGPDGSVYAGGQFTRYNAKPYYNNLAKLSSSGVLVGSYNFTPGLNSVVNNTQLRTSGSILLSGAFTSVGNNVLGVASTNAGRAVQLLPDGKIDSSFNTGGAGANNSVNDSITLPNGDILLAGGFTMFNGAARNRLAVVAGYADNAPPVITSQSSRSAKAGDFLDFSFTASGNTNTNSVTYSVVGPLPRGLHFDSKTGRVRGAPLEAGSFTVQVSATSGASLTTGPASSFVVNVTPSAVSYEQWKRAWFFDGDETNNTISGPAAVHNGAGLPNLAVYALTGGNPQSTNGLVVAPETIRGTNYLTLTAQKYDMANYGGVTNVTLVPVMSTNLSKPWLQGSNVLTTITNTETNIVLRCATPMSGTNAAKAQFIKLNVLKP